MSLVPEISIGWDYAWWFPAVYALITLAVVVICGREFSSRFFRFPAPKSFRQRIPVIVSATVFGRALMFLSIFVPLQLDTSWFWIGVLIFVFGAILTVIAMINFASTPQDQPVTKGVYRMSRNPVQVLAIIMWIGVGIATSSWIIIVASMVLVVVSYPSFLAQEHYCLEIYGTAYKEYMKSTPRWLQLRVNTRESGLLS